MSTVLSDLPGKALSAHSDSPLAAFLSVQSSSRFFCFHDNVLRSYLSLSLHQSKQETGGLGCDVVRVEVDESLTKEQLLETFITCGRDTDTHTDTHTDILYVSKSAGRTLHACTHTQVVLSDSLNSFY